MSKDDEFHIPPENIHFYEPSPEERKIMEDWIVKNHRPTNNFTFNPRFSVRTWTPPVPGGYVDDLDPLTPIYTPISITDFKMQEHRAVDWDELLRGYPESKLFGSTERSSPDSVDQFKRKPGWPIDSITITRHGVDNENAMGWFKPKTDEPEG